MRNVVLSVFSLFVSLSVLAALPIGVGKMETTRVSEYDFACLKDSEVFSTHERFDTAFQSCHNERLKAPEHVYTIDGGTYKLEGELIYPSEDSANAEDPSEAPEEPSDGTSPDPVPTFQVTYNGSQKLSQAVLEASTHTFTVEGDYTVASFYCCKSDLGPHTVQITDSEPPLELQIDLSTLPVGSEVERELYLDLTRPDGTLQQSNFVYFFIEEPITGQKTLSWSIPNKRTNGEALPIEELEGYTLFVTDGESTKQYNFEPTETQTTLELPVGEYSAYIVATDINGLTSEHSNLVALEINND